MIRWISNVLNKRNNILENDDRGCYSEKVTFHIEIYYWTEVGEISWCTVTKKMVASCWPCWYYSIYRKKWVVSKCVKYVKIRWFCIEKVRIEALKGKRFNFNENKENHGVYPSACACVDIWNVANLKMWFWIRICANKLCLPFFTTASTDTWPYVHIL